VTAKAPTYAFRQTEERRFDLRRIQRVFAEGVGVADRLRYVLAVNLALVDPVGPLPDIGPMLAKPAFEDRAIECGELTDRPQVPAGEHLSCARPDAPETLQRKRRQERSLATLGHDDQTVGLTEVRADLSAELVRGHPDGYDQPAAFAHRSLDLFRQMNAQLAF